MRPVPLVLFVLLLGSRAAGADYSRDQICRAIGQTREAALQPRDRLFFARHCACFHSSEESLGCSARGTAAARKLAKLAVILAAREEDRRAELEAEAAQREKERVEAQEAARLRRQKEEAAVQEAARREAEAVKARRKVKQDAIMPQCNAYWACLAEIRDCSAEKTALQLACRNASIETWDECYMAVPR